MKLSHMMLVLGFASIIASAIPYISGKTKKAAKEQEKNERDALFIGFWPATFFMLSKIIGDREQAGKNTITGERQSPS